MPTFGKTTDGASNSASSANRTSVSSATPASSGQVQTATVRTYIDSGTTQSKAVIYADSSGAPGAKLAESDELTVSNTTASALTYTFSGAQKINVVSGTQYWIGLAWVDPGTQSIRIMRDSTASGRQENSTYAPDPFGTPTAQTGPVDAYVTYDLPGGNDDSMFFDFF